ncbi:hypothetical protein FQN57_007165 [Myotisia sp. PD_48]|nr:hypothetical protein FQN57_007165 [Myotisia sp. PD_48]
MVRTRFVCISDTHNKRPQEAFKLPKGDVLIHAGDLTNQGTEKELERAIEWIRQADFEAKIIVPGNHDVILDREFYAQNASSYHDGEIGSSERCLDLLRSPGLIYLNHTSATIRLQDPTGPKSTFKVFGSPRLPIVASSRWHRPFGYALDAREEATQLWDQIPLDTDIVVTHTPPRDHVDALKTGTKLGCVFLGEALARVRPRLAVCGHVHEARGYKRVKWGWAIDGPTELGFKEINSVIGVLPPRDSKKQSLVDLTGKIMPCLDNDGSVGPNDSTEPRVGGRKETCFVNAAIAATQFPHPGGRKYNAPIVVDIDLPLAI